MKSYADECILSPDASGKSEGFPAVSRAFPMQQMTQKGAASVKPELCGITIKKPPIDEAFPPLPERYAKASGGNAAQKPRINQRSFKNRLIIKPSYLR